MQLSTNSHPHQSPGFTLIEVMVASLLMLVVLATILWTYRFQMFALKAQEVQLDTQQAARSMIDLLTREVRQAGYDPTCAKNFAGIATAKSQLLQLQFDKNGDGAIGAGESVTYSYDPDLKQIGRSTGAAVVPLVTSLPGNALTFTYYDGDGNLLWPSWSGASLNATQRAGVRRVQVSLHLERPNPDPRNSSKLSSDFVTNIDLRNRFINGAVACP
jgi:type IV pilus assembly protein PilW